MRLDNTRIPKKSSHTPSLHIWKPVIVVLHTYGGFRRVNFQMNFWGFFPSSTCARGSAVPGIAYGLDYLSANAEVTEPVYTLLYITSVLLLVSDLQLLDRIEYIHGIYSIF
jgi:hypothetical protein